MNNTHVLCLKCPITTSDGPKMLNLHKQLDLSGFIYAFNRIFNSRILIRRHYVQSFVQNSHQRSKDGTKSVKGLSKQVLGP